MRRSTCASLFPRRCSQCPTNTPHALPSPANIGLLNEFACGRHVQLTPKCILSTKFSTLPHNNLHPVLLFSLPPPPPPSPSSQNDACDVVALVLPALLPRSSSTVRQHHPLHRRLDSDPVRGDLYLRMVNAADKKRGKVTDATQHTETRRASLRSSRLVQHASGPILDGPRWAMPIETTPLPGMISRRQTCQSRDRTQRERR